VHAGVHRSFTMSGDASRDTKVTAANQPRRFSQKSGFGERRWGARPVATKIFSLPKIATQSPRNVLFAVVHESRQRRMRSDRPVLNRGNACGAMVSWGVDNRKRCVFAGYSHRCADVPLCCRSTRVARPAIGASTLP
jgi:hypothetical protein